MIKPIIMNKIFYIIFLFSFCLVTGSQAQIDCDDVFELLEPIPNGATAINTGTPCGFQIPGGEYVNQCSPCQRKISDDDCLLTPNPTLCDLDGFETTTGGFSEDVEWVRDPITLENLMPLQPLARFFCNGSGTIENNFWIGFTAQTNELCIEACIADCSRNLGIQVAIVETNCIDQFSQMQGPNPCTAAGISSGECLTLSANNLIPGNEYYIMVDGFAGDVCGLTLNVICGYAEPEFQIQPVLDAVLCPDVLNDGEFTPQAGSGAIVDVTVGGSATTDLTFFWLRPDGSLITSTSPTFVQGNFVRGELPGNFFTDIGTYQVQIIDNGSCCPSCEIIDLEIAMPPAAAAAVILAGIDGGGELNCINNSVNLVGNPDDGSIPAVETWQILNAAGDRVEFLEPLLVNNQNGRINDIIITQDDIENFLPGQDEGTVTFIYGFLNDLGQLCYGDAPVEFPFDFRTPEPTVDTPEEIDCLTNPTVDLIGEFSQIADNHPATYSWTFQDGTTNGIVSGADQENAVVGAPGFYTLVITDEVNGCADSVQVQVLGMVDPPSLDSIEPDTLNCNNNSLVTISSMGDAGGDPIVYSWADPAGNEILGEVNPTLDVNAPGIYTLTATNTTNGCASFVSTEITDDNPVLSISALGDSTLTCDKTSIVFPTAIVTDGNDDYTYSWSDGTTEVSTTADYTATAMGTYTLTVTDLQSGCTATQVATVAADENLPQISPLPTDLVLNCTNSEMVSTIADATDNNGAAIPGATFEWFDDLDTPLATTADIDFTDEGTYTVIVTNPANGCSSMQDVVITLDTDDPDAAIAPPAIISCVATTVTLEGSSMETNIEYQWYEGSDDTGTALGTAATETVSATGDYSLVITNLDNGCTMLVSETVTANDTEPTPDILPPAVLNCNNELTGITLDASGSTGDGTLTYAWTAPDASNAGTDAMINVTDIGEYTLLVTDMDNGCDMTTTVTVTGDFAEPENLVATGGTITCTDMNGIMLTGSSTTTNVSYLWTDIGMVEYPGQNPMVTSAGTYTLTVTNLDNGCIATTTAEVMNDSNVPTVLWTQISGETAAISCNNPARVFEGFVQGGDPNVVLTWLDPNGDPLTGNPITLDENSLEGQYTIEGVNPMNSCRGESSVSISFNFDVPEFNVDGGTIFCDPNDIVTINAEVIDPASPASFTWSDTNGQLTAGLSNPQVNQAGIYTVVATDSESGCTSTGMVEVFANNDDPIVSVAPAFDLSCRPGEDSYNLGGSATTSNGDAVTYSWELSGTEISTEANPNITDPGTYILTVTNTVSNCTETATVEVGDITLDPIPVANVQMVLNCETPMVLLEGDATDPMATYQWTSTVDPTIVIDEQSPMVGLAGDWELVVTSDNGCTGMTTVTVMDDFDLPENLMITGDNVLTCEDNSVQLTGSTSTMDIQGFEWTLDSNPTFMSMETAPNVSEPGQYTLTVTGGNGCVATATFDVTQEVGLPTVSASPQDILTCEVLETMILTSSTAVNSFYQWEGPNGFADPGDVQDITTTLDGDYSVTITDVDNGCISIAVATVQNNLDEPDVTPVGTTVTCEDVTFNISADTDVNNAMYEWGPAPFTSDLPNPEVTEAGTYMVTVTDPSNGCSTIETIEVEEGRDLPDFAFEETIALLTCNDTESVISASSMTPDVIITFSGPNTNGTQIVESGDITVTEPGVVSINFLNPANGCETTQTVTITQDITAPMPIPNAAVELNCQVLEADLSVTTNEPISSYAWSGVGITSATDIESPTVDQPGLYTVIVTAEDNGCTAEAVVEVTQDMNIPISAPSSTEINCGELVADLIGTGSTEGADISYQWLDPTGAPFSVDLNTTTTVDGEYTLVVSNSTNQCVISETVIVELDNQAPDADAGMDVDFPCSVEMVTLSGSGAGQGNLSYQWLNASGTEVGTAETIEVAQSGEFTLIVTDSDNGCTSMDSMEVRPDEDAPIIDIVTPIGLTCDVTSVNLDASGTIGIGTLTFEWFASNGAPAGSGEMIDVTNPDIYTLIVTDQSNGCDAETTISVDENTEPPVFTSIEAGVIDCTSGMADVVILGLTTANPSFEWEGPMGSGFTSIAADLIGVVNSGDYSVTITDEDNGCTAIATANVGTDEDIPQASIADADELDCVTEAVQLFGTAPDGLTYSWEGPGAILDGNTLSPTVSVAGVYELTVLNTDNGCSSITPIEVTENTNVITSISPVGDDVNCFGPNTGAIAITTNAITGGTAPYLYSIDGGASFTSQQDFLGLTAGEYDVVVQDAAGCEYDQSITINPAVDLVLELGDDQVISFGDSLLLSPQTNFDIDVAEWNDTLLMGTTPFVTPLNTTSYEITAFDEDGCVTTDFITVFVEKTRPVYIPSGFSPNGDGINDFFTVYVDADLIVGVKNFNVYDRWGESMYERSDLDITQILNETNGWDGTFRNEQMTPGVFVYHLVVEFIDGEEILYEGNITLMR